MTRKTLIIGGASGIGFAVGSLLAGRGGNSASQGLGKGAGHRARISFRH